MYGRWPKKRASNFDSSPDKWEDRSLNLILARSETEQAAGKRNRISAAGTALTPYVWRQEAVEIASQA
jgi:hypothetical protein